MTAPDREARTDLIGRPLAEAEGRLLATYEELVALLDLDLPPTAEAAVRESVAALWQAVNNLALTEHRPDV